MPDYNQVKTNVRNMIEGGAKEEQIDAYLAREGVTPDDLKAAPKAAASSPKRFPLPEEFGVSPLEEKIIDFAVPMALPTVGSAIGGAIGGVPGSAAGSFLGEAGNQALGLTERSNLQLGLAAGLPLVPSIFKRSGAFVRRFMTPRAGAETLNRLAGPEVEHFISRYAPAGKAAELFEAAKQAGGSVQMTNTLNALDDVIGQLDSASTPPAVLTNAKNLWLKIAGKNGAFDPTDLQQELEIFGKTVAKLERVEGSPFGVGKKVFSALLDDLDNAIGQGVPGAATLRLARDTFKRSAAIEDAVEISGKALKSLRGQGDAVSFNAAEVIRKLQGDKFFGQAFSQAEQKEIFGLLTNLNKIPALRPGAGIQAGSFRRIGELMMGGAGGGLVAAGGGSPGQIAVGTVAGMAIPPTQEVMRNIWIALNMREGRALMKQLLVGKAGLTEQGAGILGAFVAANLGRPEAGPIEAGPLTGTPSPPPPASLPPPNPKLLPMIGVQP